MSTLLVGWWVGHTFSKFVNFDCVGMCWNILECVESVAICLNGLECVGMCWSLLVCLCLGDLGSLGSQGCQS